MSSKVTDAVFVCCSITLTLVATVGYFGRGQRPSAREGVVGVGQAYPESTSHDHTYTVVAYIHPDCPYCTASLPFYRQLSATGAGTSTGLRFHGLARQEALRQYLERAGVERPVLTSGPLPNGVRGTPTVVVFDKWGRVVASWEGRMSARQEHALLQYFRPDSRSGALPAPQPERR